MFWRRRTRREPVLDTIGSLFHLRLSPGDRAGGVREIRGLQGRWRVERGRRRFAVIPFVIPANAGISRGTSGTGVA